MILHLCAHCGRPTPNPSICDRCQAKQPEAKRERHSRYDKLRDPERVRFYHSAAWRQLRLKKLQSVGWLCEECVSEYLAGNRRIEDIQVATDVHHVVPIAVDWSKRLDFSNLKADCAAHHNAERGKDQVPGGG